MKKRTKPMTDELLALRAENDRLTRERDAASKLWRGIAETDSAGVRELRAENERAHSYAENFLRSFVLQHFPPNPDWRPLPDLLGVLTQIDNATTITRDLRAENERLRAALKEARRFMDYFANSRTRFVGPGTPLSCLAHIDWALNPDGELLSPESTPQ